MKLTKLNALVALLFFGFLLQAQTPEGELRRWHKVTLTFNGPNTSETANPNPFSDYRLDVTFTHQGSNASYTVPGYFAACGNAENNGCNSGNKWRVHFAPDRTGTWNWSASFKSGSNVSINGGGSNAGFMNGDTGSFNIAESNKSGRDFRSKELGRLKYVGQHYLKHVGTNPGNPNGPWFIKAGADSPENAFNYVDFDATPSYNNNLNKIGNKTWQPHQRDYVASDASSYTWSNGKGTEILGMINYLSGEGANVVSFLTWNTSGDGGAVFPHVLKVSEQEYGNTARGQQWNKVHHDRFDVSKMAQWEKVMEYADKKGVYLHFKTMETENDNKMDGDNFGRERKLYYRELIARFSHHLALNWNLTEETTLKDQVAKATATYIKNIDPYDHNIVIHTYPNQQDQRYNPLLGNNSDLTGASIQTGKNNVHNDVRRWLEKSRNSGKRWVVANDEQGPASTGVRVSDKEVRHRVLWGTLMAGGTGVEYYSGYTNDDGDINGNDHRKRGKKYKEGGYALNFFNRYLQSDMINMVSSDGVTSDGNDYVFAKAGSVYAVYRPSGGSTGLSLPGGNNKYDVQWYNPRSGGNLSAKQTLGNNLVAPDNNDWVALVTSKDGDNNGGGNCGTISMQAITDFPNIAVAGFSPAYKDNARNALAINAAQYKDKFAAAEATFNGESGTYDINLATLTEIDGESTYRVSLNGTRIGEFVNPTTSTDYSPSGTTFTNIQVTKGDKIRVEFNSHTNGTIPEGNSTAYSRGRWTALNFTCVDSGGDGGDGDGGGDGDNCIPTEKNGVLAVEAEQFENQTKVADRKWYVLDGSGAATPTPDPDPDHSNGASGGGYLEILPDTRVTHGDPLVNGVSFSNTPGQVAIINYKVKFTSAGRYFVWVRAHSTGTEDNGIHVGLNGNWPASGARMQWCAGKNQWTWESKQRTNANHCGEAQKIYLDIPSAGIHTISFSMREDGFEMDKFVLSKAYNKPSGAGPDVFYTDCQDQNTPPQVAVTSPTNGASYDIGQTIPLVASASDSDGSIAKVEFYINNNLEATEQIAPYETSTIINNPGSYTITAKATDNNGATKTSSPITITVKDDSTPPTDAINIPGAFEAEDFESKSGSVRVENTPGTNTGKNLGFIKNGDFVEYNANVDSTSEYTFDFYASSKGSGGTVDIVEGGTVVGSVTIPVNGQWHDYKKYSTSVSLSSGEKPLRLVFKGGSGYLYNIDKVVTTKIQPVEQTVTLTPIHDAYMQGSTRYNNDMVRIELNKRTGYLMFDLSSINGTITKADLKFTVFSDPGNGNISVKKGNSNNWTEANLSNSNKPGKGTQLGSLNANFQIGNTKTIPLKTAQISGNRLSLVIDALSGNDFAFASKENGSVAKPQLVITYTTNRDDGLLEDDIIIYPNPIVDVMNISGTTAGKTIKVFNTVGVLVKEVALTEGQNTIDMSNLSSGYYIINILEPGKTNKILSAKKVLKR
ncbi:carbohydrate-binding protein [Aquimarina litoralis]|uniref:carbohydrate-binding protein n=1 Tax=Aquimarina litoralis TaxID=584605 RepID=UPI001C5A24E0|nr:carbohydrate-binding protein [Aquimarina litoralis]MBW1295585.1 carbohydrate-binding protein [Aquimarina litoralis]